jgi:multiple sugar transport system substrate-binding protein
MLVKRVVPLMLLLVLVLAACMPTAAPVGAPEAAEEAVEPAATDEAVELRVWFGRQDFIPADAFETFHAENPNINVAFDVIPLEEVLTQYIQAASAGQAPDIVQIDARNIPPIAEAGLTRDITDLLALWQEEDPETYSDLSDSAFNFGRYKDVPFGVAFHAGPFNHVYRIDVLEEYGLNPPETWEDVLEIARAVRTDEMLGYALIGARHTVWFFSKFYAMGGQFEDNVIQLDSEAGHALLSFYQTLAAEELIHPETLAWASGEMRAAFIGGDAAQAPIGSNLFPRIQEAMPYGEMWGAMPPPYREGAEDEWRYMGLGWPHVITASTEHPYEASLVLRYLARAENAGEVAMRYQPTTVTSVMASEEYQEVAPWAPDFADWYPQMTPMAAHPKQPEIEQVVIDAFQQVLDEPDADVAEVAQRAQEEIDAIVAE